MSYTGREDDGTGLKYYRARYYHPTLSRFLREDPLRWKGGVNLYAYVNANPINLIDPLGLRPLRDCEKNTLRPYIPEIEPLLRDDELHRESDRHAAARHAEHQALARWRHAAAVDRARLAPRRRALPPHQAASRVRRARDRARYRHRLGARRVSHRGIAGEHARPQLAQNRSSQGGPLCRYPPDCGEQKV